MEQFDAILQQRIEQEIGRLTVQNLANQVRADIADAELRGLRAQQTLAAANEQAQAQG